jgi:hypothetical protein
MTLANDSPNARLTKEDVRAIESHVAGGFKLTLRQVFRGPDLKAWRRRIRLLGPEDQAKVLRRELETAGLMTIRPDHFACYQG